METGPVCRRLALVVTLLALWQNTAASLDSRIPEVDLELVLAVDVSPSMNAAERALQRNGYISAFHHPDVLSAIRSGPLGRVAVTYVEWAGPQHQLVAVPWTVLSGEHDIIRFTDKLLQAQPTTNPGTSISGSLLHAFGLFQSSPVRGLRRVVDVSGDGINNSGLPIAAIRERLVSMGIVINGLPITVQKNEMRDDFRRYDSGHLASYYEHCVIGGPGAFLITVDDLTKIASAIKRKLVLEISALKPRLVSAAYLPKRQDFDCTGPTDQPGR